MSWISYKFGDKMPPLGRYWITDIYERVIEFEILSDGHDMWWCNYMNTHYDDGQPDPDANGPDSTIVAYMAVSIPAPYRPE